ncbi:MAG: hypothetical protein AVDCRST_MAG59-1355 [uncultured Thermomicrobiales bacterium]|uniref:Bacteriophage lambda Replication protein O N-terminal domain-containing protein n=1 Tax=uncultured Thermomicrobiales bacterium TaxID=1645740 RepID=A0A6J4UCS7_9BACT|nr:MAG: hypothetical protein AVDCRST_MAG59-1355 [uncultured Thermomicrobiales bacterium]
MARRKGPRAEFPGFDRPASNFFRMPNSWTDITAEIDSIAELKVVEYILRHTWGYQEYGLKKHITIEEFVNGRRRQDGGRLDKGTGLSERAVYDGLRKAVENGLIEEEVDDADRGRVKKFYSLRMRDDAAAGDPLQTLQPGVQSLHPPLQSLQGRGANFAPRTEKETLERNVELSNFEGSDARFEQPTRRPTARPAGVDAAAEPDEGEPGIGVTDEASLGEVVEQRGRAQVRAAPQQTRQPPGTVEEREHLAAFLEDFAAELGDEAPLSSTITRVLNIFKAAGVPPERWGDHLYQARGRTQEATGRITKQAVGNGSGIRRKNKAPYFLATLEQLVGLRPVASP